jgi:oligopeptide/dipeptide ABC transporter ATP-binding protein
LLVKVDELKKYYYLRKGGLFGKGYNVVKAVDDVSFDIDVGETLGLVGESGSGKSTLGRVLLLLEEKTDGNIWFDGVEIEELTKGDRRKWMGQIQVVFQDPYDSLNPKMRVGDIISEPIKNQKVLKGNRVRDRVSEVLEKVGLRPEDSKKFPHQFSGGQRQRIGIARAISTNPRFVVLDEPVSSLDVSIQAQIINLLIEIQKEYKIAYLFISHNIAVIEHVADRIAVMYLGKIVEQMGSEKIHHQSVHPYTQALISAFPIPDPNVEQREITLGGEIPSPIHAPSGCRFHPRCERVMEECLYKEPTLVMIEEDHFVACHHFQ